MNVVLETATEIIEHVEHKDRERSLGGIQITRAVLEKVASKLECSGAISNENGQLDCPIRETTYGARNMAIGPWPQANYAVALDEGVTTTPHHVSEAPGNYL